MLAPILRSDFGPRKVSKLKRPMCTKRYSLQYETVAFAFPKEPEIEEKIKYIKSAISNAVEMAERYNDLETFDHENGGKVEDMLMDIYHCFDVILHAFIE